MPARRKPTAMLEATGAFQKNPQRRRERANEPTWNGPVGDPPDWFDRHLAQVWSELEAHAAPGVLARSDSLLLEITSVLLFKYRHAPELMPRWLEKIGDAMKAQGLPAFVVKRMQNALFKQVRMSPSETKTLTNCLAQMGMNPKRRLA